MAWQWRFFVFKACDVNDSYWTVNVEMNVWQRRDNYRRETEKRHLRDARDGAIRPSRSVVAARESLSGVFRGSLEAYSPGACSQVSGRSDILQVIRFRKWVTSCNINSPDFNKSTGSSSVGGSSTAELCIPAMLAAVWCLMQKFSCIHHRKIAVPSSLRPLSTWSTSLELELSFEFEL